MRVAQLAAGEASALEGDITGYTLITCFTLASKVAVERERYKITVYWVRLAVV